MKTKEQPEESNYKKQRDDFEFNQAAVRDAYIDILKEKKGRKPTLHELAERTTLNVKTVRAHLKEIDRRGLAEVKEVDSLRILTDDIKLAIYRAAMKGNPASQKLWFQIVEGWSEKTEAKVLAKVENVNAPPVILKITRK